MTEKSKKKWWFWVLMGIGILIIAFFSWSSGFDDGWEEGHQYFIESQEAYSNCVSWFCNGEDLDFDCETGIQIDTDECNLEDGCDIDVSGSADHIVVDRWCTEIITGGKLI